MVGAKVGVADLSCFCLRNPDAAFRAVDERDTLFKSASDIGWILGDVLPGVLYHSRETDHSVDLFAIFDSSQSGQNEHDYQYE